MRSIAVLVVIVLAQSVAAQVSITAFATQPLVVSSASAGSQTYPAGPLPSAGVSLISAPAAAWSTLRVQPWPTVLAPVPRGGSGWIFSGTVNVGFSPPGGADIASLSGQVQLQFSSPQPVSGLLYMWATYSDGPQFQTSSGDFNLDVDCDGIPDYAASAWNDRNVQLPLTVDATGATLCVDMSLAGSLTYWGPNSVYEDARAAWTVVFIPGGYGLERRSAGCEPLLTHRNPNLQFRPAIGGGPPLAAPDILAGVFAIGLSEQSVTLPYPPGCPLLVANPAIVLPAIQSTRSITLYPPDLSLPPGLQFYCQAIWVDTQAQYHTTDSMRTF